MWITAQTNYLTLFPLLRYIIHYFCFVLFVSSVFMYIVFCMHWLALPKMNAMQCIAQWLRNDYVDFCCFLILDAISMHLQHPLIHWRSSVQMRSRKKNRFCASIERWARRYMLLLYSAFICIHTASHHSCHAVVRFCHFPVTLLLQLKRMDYLHLWYWWCGVVCLLLLLFCCFFCYSVNFIAIHRNDRINVDYTMFYQFMVLNFKIAGVKT